MPKNQLPSEPVYTETPDGPPPPAAGDCHNGDGVTSFTIREPRILEVGERPQTDAEWREAIAFIKANLKGIMAICNKQAGHNAYVEAMPHDQAVLFWYGHLSDEIINKTKKRLGALEGSAIDV